MELESLIWLEIIAVIGVVVSAFIRYATIKPVQDARKSRET